MTLKIFTVYDLKSETYLPPFCMRSKGEALRSWQTIVNDDQSNFSKFPADFTLYEIGSFDDNSGELVYYPRISLGSALEFRKNNVTDVKEI